MPQEITNQDIRNLIDVNVASLDEINRMQDDFTKSLEPLIDKLNQQNLVFKNVMDSEYGWGKWHGVNAKEYTFLSKEEFQKNWYVINNPDIKESAQSDDITLNEGQEHEEASGIPESTGENSSEGGGISESSGSDISISHAESESSGETSESKPEESSNA